MYNEIQLTYERYFKRIAACSIVTRSISPMKRERHRYTRTLVPAG